MLVSLLRYTLGIYQKKLEGIMTERAGRGTGAGLGQTLDQDTIQTLREIIGDNEDVDFVDISSVLFGLFEGIVQPDIFLTFSNKVSLQQIFTVKVRAVFCTLHCMVCSDCALNLALLPSPLSSLLQMGGGGKILKLLQQPETLFSLPLSLQKGIFDLLYVVLRRGTYDVAKFQHNLEEGTIESNESSDQSPARSMTSILLDLLQVTPNDGPQAVPEKIELLPR